MKIALDFDDTYTKDPDLWIKFADHCRSRGHTLCIVTARPDDNDNFDIEMSMLVKMMDIRVIYCSYYPKRHYCATVLDMHFDVWIDDSPEAIISRTDEVSFDWEEG